MIHFIGKLIKVHLWVDDELGVALGGRAEDVCDLVDLVEVVLAREGGPVAHHLGQAAAHAPHVHALRVALQSKRRSYFHKIGVTL